MGSKRLKPEEKEDRISALPDCIIHHILSFLPSTKQAIQTGILSKRWQNQWIHLGVFILDSSGMSFKNFLKFIDNTSIRHDCSKINKFHLQYGNSNRIGPQFTAEVRFAKGRAVEELDLSSDKRFLLPDFLFNNASLVKLTTHNCTFMPRGKVNWRCLTTLNMENFNLRVQAMEHILSGSPLLKSLELSDTYFEFDKLVIHSESLKRLVLRELTSIVDIEISCPKLEKLKLVDCLNVKTTTLLNLPSSLCVTIDFYHHEDVWSDSTKAIRQSLIKEILKQLQHVKKLKIGNWFIQILTDLEPTDDICLPVLNINCLTLNCPDLNEHHSGIARILRNSPMLEKLVINVAFYDRDFDAFGEYYWSSNAAFLDCLVSQLKRIKINGFPKRDEEHILVLKFAQFLLNNATVLEKMVLVLKVHGTVFSFKVSQLLLSLPWLV